MEFPSNSQQPIRPSEGAPKPPEKKTVLKVVDDGVEVVRRKKTVGDKLKSMFLEDGKKKFEAYVVDVLFPSARDMLFDAATQALARAILGEDRAASIKSSTARTITSRLVGNSPRHIDYDRFSKRGSGIGSSGLSRVARVHHDFEEVILPSHNDAMRVIATMKDMAERYNAVTVGDLYDMIGEESTFADEKYGWLLEDLEDARPRSVRSGFLLDLRKPEPLRIR
jgi:hypothetical protein